MGLIFSKAAGCMPAILLEVGSFMVVSQILRLFYYSLFEQLFLENCPYWLLNNFKYIFHFNLTRKERLLKSTLCQWIFDKYLVLRQSFIINQI